MKYVRGFARNTYYFKNRKTINEVALKIMRIETKTKRVRHFDKLYIIVII